MHFSTITASAIFALALHLPNTLAAERENWRVNAYKDNLCQEKTGSWSHNAPREFESFEGLPDILSVDTRGPIGFKCGWNIVTFSDDEDNRSAVSAGTCLRVQTIGEWKNPITGFRVKELYCDE